MINKLNCCYANKVIPLAFDESMSYLEQLCAMLNSLNEVIDKVNKLAKTVDEIDINFDEINAKIEIINSEIDDLNDNFVIFEERITNTTNTKIAENYAQVISLMNSYQATFNAQIQALKVELEAEIEAIELGNVKAYDPTTGQISNINIVLQNIYDSVRNNAITCTEFEALNLTCTSFEAYQITARQFDLEAKIILV